jgi:hypothetical protein
LPPERSLPHGQKREETSLCCPRATEYLFLENIALKLELEHREVANWQKLLDHLLSDKEMLAAVRLKFSDLYREIEKSPDPSSVLSLSSAGFQRQKRRTSPLLTATAIFRHTSLASVKRFW